MPLENTSKSLQDLVRPVVEEVTIPTVRLGQRLHSLDDNQYAPDSALAKLYAKTKPGVVQISAGPDSQPHGSGFFVDKDGKILTAFHCVEFYDSVQIKTADSKVYKARVVATEPNLDLAQLQVIGAENADFKPLKLRDKTSDLQAGDELNALGHPLELEPVYISPGQYRRTAPAGEQAYLPINVSGRNNFLPLIQAHMHVESGNSGGPVVDKNGEVVGITSSGSATNDQIIPVETIRHAMGQSVQPYYPSYLPQSWHWGAQATMLSAEAGVVGTIRLAGKARGSRKAAELVGLEEFILHDANPFVAAWYRGSGAEKLSESINVFGDALMVGSMVFGSHGKGLAVALSGLGVKLANNLGDRRRFW